MSDTYIKEKLFEYCNNYLQVKLERVEASIISFKQALNGETKSSAGDKHETGRAMVQLEMEKAGQQHLQLLQQKALLEKTDIQMPSEVIRMGSLVLTNQMNYFVAISVGKIELEEQEFYGISPHSPIGKVLLGQQKEAEVFFNGKKIIIESIM